MTATALLALATLSQPMLPGGPTPLTPEQRSALLAAENWAFAHKNLALMEQIRQKEAEIRAINGQLAGKDRETKRHLLLKQQQLGKDVEKLQDDVQAIAIEHNRIVQNLTTYMAGSRPPGSFGPSHWGNAPLPTRPTSVYGPNGGYNHVPPGHR